MDPTSALIATDHIQIEVAIRLGRTRLSVAQLSQLAPDDILPLDETIGDQVEICIGERVVAHGELVDDESGRLMVRITGAATL